MKIKLLRLKKRPRFRQEGVVPLLGECEDARTKFNVRI